MATSYSVASLRTFSQSWARRFGLKLLGRPIAWHRSSQPLKPSGTFSAPSVPSQSQLVFKGGSVRFQPRANLVTAVAGFAGQMLVEPLSDAISDNIIFPLMEKALGRDIPSAAEMRRLQQQPEQIRSRKDAAIETPSQALVEAPVPALNVINDAEQAIQDSTPLQPIVEETPMLQPHSPSPEDDERNREYLIRRAALGDNPTQEEIDAVVAYGLEQHKINFPHLY